MTSPLKEIELPRECTLCGIVAEGKDLDPTKDIDGAHLFQWTSDPELYVLFCQECWERIKQITCIWTEWEQDDEEETRND